jgi:hypothetical protein
LGKFAISVGTRLRDGCRLARGALPAAKRGDRSRPGAGRSKFLISLIALRTRPVAGSKEDKRALNFLAPQAMQRVAFTGLIPHHPRETHFLAAGHASHRTCSSQTVVTHRTPWTLIASRRSAKSAETCGCLATLGASDDLADASQECRPHSDPEQVGSAGFQPADGLSVHWLSSAAIFAARTAGRSPADFRDAAAAALGATKPARPGRPISCARRTCASSPSPR